MNKKILTYIIALIILVVLVVGGIWGYQYWRQGTPAYSINQLEQAFADHDTTTAGKYLNADTIWSNIWPRFETDYGASENSSSALLTAVLNAQESTIKNVFSTTVYNDIRGTGNTTAPLVQIITQLPNKKPIVHGGTALINVTLQDSTNGTAYPITVVLTQQSDRTWQITDLQGLEKFMVDTVVPQQTASSTTP